MAKALSREQASFSNHERRRALQSESESIYRDIYISNRIETVLHRQCQAQVRAPPRSKYVAPRKHPGRNLLTFAKDEVYKSAKLDSNGDARSKGKASIVEDEGEDGEAGPELPPDFDEEDVPDDEEGRFFGGGMDRKTTQAMEYIDQQEDDETAVWGICSMITGQVLTAFI